MVSGDAVPSVRPEMSLRDALDQLHRSGLDGLPSSVGSPDRDRDSPAMAKAVAEAARNRLDRGVAAS